ncbi:MAG: FMN-binding protein [Pseudomonadales bacterium]
MKAGEESVGRTMLVAIGVALFCSAMVTVAVHVLRPVQAAYAAVERNRAIVEAAGLAPAEASDDAVVREFLSLDVAVIELATGAVVEGVDGHAFDHWAATAAAAAAGDDRPAQVPIYLRRESGALVRVVLPVDGRGMWSTIRGYLALAPDLDTVAALVVYEHGETPGIGDRIEDPGWLALWQDKRLRNTAGEIAINVSDDPALPRENRVDTITGATVTSKAVGRLVRDWLGSDGYAAALAALAAREGIEQ